MHKNSESRTDGIRFRRAESSKKVLFFYFLMLFRAFLRSESVYVFFNIFMPTEDAIRDEVSRAMPRRRR